MKRKLQDYGRIVDAEKLEQIRAEAEELKGKRLVHINSTWVGGGVAEMLQPLVLLFNDLGIKTEWRVLHGTIDFFNVTKSFHNALHGADLRLSERKKRIYLEHNANFAAISHLDYFDFVVVHDPQPLPLIKFHQKVAPWIWRCHIDLTNPHPELWSWLLEEFIKKHDRVVLSSEEFKRPELDLPVDIIRPCIDPLSTKNKYISEHVAKKQLSRVGIDLEKPLLLQVSRFDPWKDPLGVIRVFEKVKQHEDCQLVLCGSFASDDPEGFKMYNLVKKYEREDIKIILNASDLLVNALQRSATVVIQKSLREGFGLTVTEALWKGTPVVASKVGGIPLQVINGKPGFLLDPKDEEGFAKRILELIRNPALREELGRAGREWVRQNFLITNNLHSWLQVLKKTLSYSI